MTAPGNISVTANVPAGAEATLAPVAAFLNGASAGDIVDPDPTITHNGPSVFPVGQTTVTFTATDDSNNQATATATVTVE